MPLDFQNDEVRNCLNELGAEYLRVGADSCENMQDGSQLSAFLLLGIRSISLCHGLRLLWKQSWLDSFDVTRRAFLEACYLLYEFRLKDSEKKTKLWLQGAKDSWSPRFKKWEELVLVEGPPAFGPEYGEFSELAHPTIQAA